MLGGSPSQQTVASEGLSWDPLLVSKARSLLVGGGASQRISIIYKYVHANMWQIVMHVHAYMVYVLYPPKKNRWRIHEKSNMLWLGDSTQHIVPSCSFRSQLHFVSIIPSTFSASEKTRFLMKFSVFYKDRSVPPKKRQPSDPDFVKGALVLSIDVPTGVIYTRYT